MKKLKMFCLSMDPSHLNKITKLNYIPVGLGNKNYNNKWMTDKEGNNMSKKNEFYGEYTFHYWLWKNSLGNFSDEWIGFCQYRKFWTLNEFDLNTNNFEEFKANILKEIPNNYEKFESIIGVPIYTNHFRLSKFIKHNLFEMILKPSLFLNKKKRNIKFHFDMMHGKGNLFKAINLLDKKDKNDFTFFVENSVSFNPHNMFICKSKKILGNYYESVFPWLEKCEKVFGFNLKGYGEKRMYGFLAERFMSYWFQKYTNFKVMPIIFKDLTDFQ